MICLSSASHFPPMLYSNVMKPVILPPGRARLSTMPAPTGSPTTGNTIGMVRVAWIIAVVPETAVRQDDVRRGRSQLRRVLAQ